MSDDCYFSLSQWSEIFSLVSAGGKWSSDGYHGREVWKVRPCRPNNQKAVNIDRESQNAGTRDFPFPIW